MFEVLADLLGSRHYSKFVAVVAWARTSGLTRLGPSVRDFRDRGGASEIILGVDEGGASLEGLTAATLIFDDAKVLYDSSSGTFHPKLWLFSGDEYAAAIVGSNNLTAGGLYLNYEVALLVDFDLRLETDRVPYEELVSYVARLRNDGTARPLTEDLIERLRESAEFTIKDEARGRSRTLTAAEPGDGPGIPYAAEQLFGKSLHKKKGDPARPPRSATVTPSDEGRHALQVAGTPLIGGSNAPVVVSWSKTLTRSDCGRPNPGSNTTSALRFTKAGYDIDQSTWFRRVLFNDATWTPDAVRDGERTVIRFDVVINGLARGTHELEIKYDLKREAGQGNFTTDLKWGSLTPVLQDVDLVGHTVYIDKHADGALTMRIASAEDLIEDE